MDVRQLFTALVFTNTSMYAVGSALDSSALGGVLYFGVFGTMTSVYTAFTNCSCVGISRILQMGTHKVVLLTWVMPQPPMSPSLWTT